MNRKNEKRATQLRNDVMELLRAEPLEVRFTVLAEAFGAFLSARDQRAQHCACFVAQAQAFAEDWDKQRAALSLLEGKAA